MKLRLETVTYLHIGSGTEIPPTEYWFDPQAGLVHRLNVAGLVQDRAFLPHLENFVREAAQGRQIDRYVPREVLRPHSLYELPALGEARGHLAQHPTVIKALLLSGGRVFIPGSSIKGSLLSALFWHLLIKEAEADASFRRSLAQALQEAKTRESPRRYGELLALTLGRVCQGTPNRFSRWLAVSDTNLLPPHGRLAVILVEVVGARTGGQIPVLMETLRPGVSLVCELSLPAGACQGRAPAFSPEELLRLADDFYRRIWHKVEQAPPPEGGWLLRLGQGSGAWATSLLLVAEDLRLPYRVSPPATRKLADGRHSLGWVLLTPHTGEVPEPPAASAAPGALPPGTPPAAAAPFHPSPRLRDLLERLKAVRPFDSGRVGAFLDALQTLETPAEKAALARALLHHFDRRVLEKNKRWHLLKPYADTAP